MNKNYTGVIIKESLENQNPLNKVNIINTRIESVIEKHKTPWIKQWTLYTVEIEQNQADIIAKELSENLDSQHNWYTDFKNKDYHYIIFRNKIFKVDRSKKEEYANVTQYGMRLGIPKYQLDFSPDIKEWER